LAVRIEVPDTPDFWNRLESELRSSTPHRKRRRLGVPVTAMRALRAFTRHAVHASAVAGLAFVMIVSWSKPIGDTASVTIGAAPDVPGYLVQYGASIDAETTVARARYDGYEVSVRRIFTPHPDEDGRILEERHPGPVTVDHARGPLLFVIGYTIGNGDTTAN
jgi:hypothetical protein